MIQMSICWRNFETLLNHVQNIIICRFHHVTYDDMLNPFAADEGKRYWTIVHCFISATIIVDWTDVSTSQCL
jgi:hypothetical protein